MPRASGKLQERDAGSASPNVGSAWPDKMLTWWVCDQLPAPECDKRGCGLSLESVGYWRPQSRPYNVTRGWSLAALQESVGWPPRPLLLCLLLVGLKLIFT